MRATRRVARVALLAAASMIASTPASAGSIHPALQEVLDLSPGGSHASAILFLEEQVPLDVLKSRPRGTSSTRRERHSRVIRALRATAAATQGAVREQIDLEMRSGAVTGYSCLWIVNAIVVEADREAIARLAALPEIETVEPNFVAETIAEPPGDTGGRPAAASGIGIPPGVRAVRAPEVWRELGITGSGRVIAILDSGVDGTHPALASRWRGSDPSIPWWQCWRDVTGRNLRTPVDYDGHGTAVMGTVVGLSAETGDTIGVAWGAKWIASNATDMGPGARFDNAVLDALQWFADPDDDPETIEDVPDVLSNSWGISEILHRSYSDCDRRWWTAIDNLEAAGVVTIWGVGNGGPSAQVIRSPADRATTPTNAFSVGAVDATHFDWPYPVADFSGRGPTGCDVPADLKIKPEVVAPGVHIYSSIRGGTYSDNRSGTSAATPHVAGVVALIRQANPELDVDTIKEILIATARDVGEPGEDNATGWGVVDAYDAVIMATRGLGGLEGRVTNERHFDDLVPGATVTLLECGASFTADEEGYFRGWAPVGTYRVETRHPDFRSDTIRVELTGGVVTPQDIRLIDDRGPRIHEISRDLTTTDSIGPYVIRAQGADPSRVSALRLHYRVNGRRWVDSAMSQDSSGAYVAAIAGQLPGTRIDYYISAEDHSTSRNRSCMPAEAPAEAYSLHVTQAVFQDDMETDRGWAVSAIGDRASGGAWTRRDPNGTYLHDALFQMEDDHTPAPGVRCFVTGNGPPGSAPSEHDVDGGCTTLTSPIIDLTGAHRAFVTYHRWFAQAVWYKDKLEVDVSSDGGATWSPLERVSQRPPEWTRAAFDIGTTVALTGSMRFRFRACDTENNALIEAGVDDFAIETFDARPGNPWIPVDGNRAAELSQNEPNPGSPATTIRFWLRQPTPARLDVFDSSGRRVRTLVDGPLPAGPQEIPWDGRDGSGRSVPSGMYFYRLSAGSFVQSRMLAILR